MQPDAFLCKLKDAFGYRNRTLLQARKFITRKEYVNDFFRSHCHLRSMDLHLNRSRFFLFTL